MKKIKILIVVSWLVILPMIPAHGQGTFQNLNFEQANPVSVGNPLDPGLVTTVSALPYWTVYYTSVQQTDVEYNEISTGETEIDLVSTANQFVQPIDGTYSVLLQGIAPASTASIAQTGLIPPGTRTLLFEAEPVKVPVGGPGPLALLVGAQVVPFGAIGSEPNYTLYAANISAWAGQTESIDFSALGGSYNNWELDDISFSTSAVPEPSPLVLTGIGGLLFALYRRFAPKPR